MFFLPQNDGFQIVCQPAINILTRLNRQYELNPDNFFTLSEDNLRGHSFKLSKHSSRTDIRKNYFSNRVVNEWNKLDDTTVTANNLSTFKERLELGADARA